MDVSNASGEISGVRVEPLRQMGDERGKVMHMLRADSPLFTAFGEIYFSVVNPGVVKAWKKHLKMTQHFAVPSGKIRLVMYDDREGSGTYGKIQILDVGEWNYCLVKIPPRICYGFKGISKEPALIANCTDMPHDPEEIQRFDVSDRRVPFDWSTDPA